MPGPDAPAASRPLVGRGLRDRLDRQPLGLATRRVAADPGRARVDHVADARHGQRRFGHVGGEHDPAVRVRLEDAMLVRCRQPGVQRQDLRLAARRRRWATSADVLAVSWMSRSVGRKTSMSPSSMRASSSTAPQHGVCPSPARPPSSSVRVQRTVADLDRIGPAGDLDDGRRLVPCPDRVKCRRTARRRSWPR